MSTRWPPAGLALLQKKYAQESGIHPMGTPVPGQERRRYKRLSIPPVIVLSKSLSDQPILLEDVCLEGFCSVFDTHIRPGTNYAVRLVSETEVIDACQARAIWVQINYTIPLTWTLGFQFLLPSHARERWKRSLNALQAARGV